MAPLLAKDPARQQALLASTILLLILPFPFVALRIWSRRIKRSPLSLNDYLLLLALLFTSGYNVSMIFATTIGGYGQHLIALNADEIESNMKITIVATLLWPTANSLIKLSVLHFYKTVFPHTKLGYAVYFVAALTLAYWFATILPGFLICRPFQYHWNKMISSGHCGDLIAYYLSTGIINLIIDVIIVALPLPILGSLHLPTSRKVSLIIIFSLGALICFISIARVIAIAKLNLKDVTYDIVLDNILTALEPTLGVINACLPLLQPVVTKLSGIQILPWLKSFRSLKSSERGLTGTETKQHSMKDRSDNFRRLTPDLYPLTDLSVTQQSIYDAEEQ